MQLQLLTVDAWAAHVYLVFESLHHTLALPSVQPPATADSLNYITHINTPDSTALWCCSLKLLSEQFPLHRPAAPSYCNG
jgi:hypothetical protein